MSITAIAAGGLKLLQGLGGSVTSLPGEIIGGIFGEKQSSCQGVTYCVKNRRGLSCDGLIQAFDSIPSDLLNEWLGTLQGFVTAEWNRKSGNSKKNGLPRVVTKSNAAGATLYLLGGENDCDFGGLEKRWESGWDQWVARVRQVAPSIPVDGTPTVQPTPTAPEILRDVGRQAFETAGAIEGATAGAQVGARAALPFGTGNVAPGLLFAGLGALVFFTVRKR